MRAYSRLIIFLWLITFGLISTAMLIAQRLPRAAELAYVSSAGLHPAIYRMEIERNLHVPLTDDAFAAYAPAWSPDGEFIAYYAIREGSRDLYLMNVLGRDVRRLTRQQVKRCQPFRWGTRTRRILRVAKRQPQVIWRDRHERDTAVVQPQSCRDLSRACGHTHNLYVQTNEGNGRWGRCW